VQVSIRGVRQRAALIVAVGLVLCGCGNEHPPRREATPTEQARTYSESVNLRLGDVPKATDGLQKEKEITPGPSEVALARCVGIGPPALVVDRLSPEFQTFQGEQHFESKVEVYRSSQDAVRESVALNTRAGHECRRRMLLSFYDEKTGRPTHESEVHTTFLSLPLAKHVRGGDTNTTSTLVGEHFESRERVDQDEMLVGAARVTLTTVAFNSQVPPALVRRLLAVLYDRAMDGAQ
jgi:hypothetical protein